MPQYPDWVEDRFGDDIPEWAEDRWGDDDDDDDQIFNKIKRLVEIQVFLCLLASTKTF